MRDGGRVREKDREGRMKGSIKGRKRDAVRNKVRGREIMYQYSHTFTSS